jgi:hypothetical protein
MKKFIRVILFTLFVVFLSTRISCDAFENFLLNLPISFVITASGSTNPSGSGSECLEDDETYQQYEEKINSISLVEIYFAVLSVNPNSLSGDVSLNVYGGTSGFGELLFSYQMDNLSPSDYQVPNPALKLTLTAADIQRVNSYLAEESSSKCFYGELIIDNIQNGGTTNTIQVRIDALFQLDTDL